MKKHIGWLDGYIPVAPSCKTCDECSLPVEYCDGLHEIFNELWAYQDTNLTPEEIAALQAENTRLRAELEAAVKDLEEAASCMTCAMDWDCENSNSNGCSNGCYKWRRLV